MQSNTLTHGSKKKEWKMANEDDQTSAGDVHHKASMKQREREMRKRASKPSFLSKGLGGTSERFPKRARVNGPQDHHSMQKCCSAQQRSR